MRALLLALTLVVIGESSLAAQSTAAAGFTPGIYRALPRDASAFNRYQSVEFDFQSGGLLIWRRGSMVELLMQWRAAGDIFEVEESVGCSMAPVGQYRVVRWLGGFVLQVIRDGCTMRVAAVNEFYLVRSESTMVRRPGQDADPASN